VPPPVGLQRSVLNAPDAVARTAARYVPEPEGRWMLHQARSVRRSYAREVLGSEHPHAQEIWMLRQADDVRESYVREVLEAGG
jgi:hypothetical protein